MTLCSIGRLVLAGDYSEGGAGYVIAKQQLQQTILQSRNSKPTITSLDKYPAKAQLGRNYFIAFVACVYIRHSV